MLDLDIYGANFGRSPATFAQGDANADGRVDLLDLDTLGAVFCQPAPVSGGSRSVATPEPSAAAILVTMLAAAAALGRLR